MKLEKTSVKKAFLGVGIAGMSLMYATSFFNEAQATSVGNGRQVVGTYCYKSGVWVGYANDCGNGSGNCIDTTCQ